MSAHPWSPWRSLPNGMMERRCPCCRAVERAAPEALLTAELDRLRAVVAAYRRVFGEEARDE
jgi:hypothetical protein